MRLRRFEYHTPADLETACRILSEHPESAAVLAGGTDLLVDLKEETVYWDHLVSLRQVVAVRGISFDEKEGLTIGSAVTLSEIARSETIRRTYPGLAEAARSVGGVQIRNRGTIGGNICSAVPSADLPPVLLAAESDFLLAGSDRERRLAASKFFTGPRRTALRPGEILVSIRVPPPAKNSGSCYLKFSLREAMALAVAGVAAEVVMDGDLCSEGRIALGAVAPVPMIAVKAGAALEGAVINETLARRIGKIAREECKPITDIRGSEEFRRELVAALTQRALLKAAERARVHSRK